MGFYRKSNSSRLGDDSANFHLLPGSAEIFSSLCVHFLRGEMGENRAREAVEGGTSGSSPAPLLNVVHSCTVVVAK
jgi:hypothetical protein